jgi:sugar transferase EpsL
LKRVVDVVGAWVGLAVSTPVIAVVALAVRVKLGSPVFSRQQRAGLGGRPFELTKFRTMTSERDATGALLPDEARLTSFGRFLRSTSLDELPELLHELRGDMSLVGPRPLPVAYLPRYDARQSRRHEVKPGLTGWAQVNGRNTADWPERLEMDVWYVEHRSLWLDLRILWRTVRVVLQRSGVSEDGHATMTEFLGN